MRRLLSFVSLALVAWWGASGQTYTISTFAGGGLPGNVPATSTGLNRLVGVAIDKSGNVFFSDAFDVFRVDAATGVLTVVAGNGTSGFSGDNGLATNAQLSSAQGVAVDSAGNLYIADTGNNRIRRVSNGVISTVVGNGTAGFSGDNGPAVSAQVATPLGLTFDSAGNLYFADSNRIRRVSKGVITTVAGNGTQGFSGDSGPATAAQFNGARGLAVDFAGNLYVADVSNNRVREISNGVITTVAGGGVASGDNGPATSAQVASPMGVAVDSNGNLYIVQGVPGRVRMVSNGVITTVAGAGLLGYSGDNGPATAALLNDPQGVAVDSAGNLYIADTQNGCIRKVSNGVITTVAGNGVVGYSGENGPAANALLNQPWGLAVDSAGSLYIADEGANLVLKVAGGAISTVAGNGTAGNSGDDGPATAAQLNSPQGVAVDSAGNLYIADGRNYRIRMVSKGVITTVAGNGHNGFGGDSGPATGAQLGIPAGVAVDASGSLYIADGNNRIRKVTNGIITTVAGTGTAGFSGDGGPAASAQLSSPTSVAVDSAGNLYIADTNNSRVRKVSNGVITTVVTGIVSNGIAVDSTGNLYVDGAFSVFRVTGGALSRVAGNGTQGFSGDGGPATGAELYSPTGVAADNAGNVYVADYSERRVRILTPGTAPSISHGGVVPVYSTVPTIQPGSWVSIYGTNLASGTVLWSGNFPKTLGGTSVTIDGKSAYLWYVSPTQINLQVPDDSATGTVQVVVTTASGTAAATVTLAPYGPSFSLLGDGKHVAAEIATPNGAGAYGGGTYDLLGPANTYSYSARPAKAGETLVLFGVGFGPTAPQVAAGQAYSGAAPTTSPVTVTIGGVTANVVFSGITAAGLYQINLTVPQGIAGGDQALQATVNGVQTPAGPVVSVQ